jgi:hypothetical protein
MSTTFFTYLIPRKTLSPHTLPLSPKRFRRPSLFRLRVRGGNYTNRNDDANDGTTDNSNNTNKHQNISFTMAESGTGIQELMAAETRASQIVAEARIGEF